MVYFNLIVIHSVPSGPPQNFTISFKSRNITLSWSPPLLSQWNGEIISYSLTCNISGTTSSVRRNITSIEIPVEPFTGYSCAVSAATVVGDGPATAVVSGITDEDSECPVHVHSSSLSIVGPGSPTRKLSAVSNSCSSLSLSWKVPLKSNGMITKYKLKCSGGGQVFNWSVIGSQTTTRLSGLQPYTKYSCSITAHTSVGGGPAATTSVTTEEGSKCTLSNFYTRLC